MAQKNHLLYPLIAAAVVSVTTFSCLGIAAITGHLSVGEGSADPFFAFTPGATGAAQVIAPPSPLGPMHIGLTRQSGTEPNQATRPFGFRPGQRIAPPPCSTCGVIQSIEPRSRTAAGDDSTANAIAIPMHIAALNTSDADPANDTAVAASGNAGIISFVVRVKMTDGTVRTIYESQRPRFSVGERVRLINGSLMSMG
jgi:hypothetical protein